MEDANNHQCDMAMASQRTVVRDTFKFFICYIISSIFVVCCMIVFYPNSFHFSSGSTLTLLDALYFCVVTMCTIGYGDITPATPFAKIISIALVLCGFGCIDILLADMVAFALEQQESRFLTEVTKPKNLCRHNLARRYVIDVKKGRMRIRLKVIFAAAVVVLCVGIGAIVLYFIENLNGLDALYLSVMSVTTVGYGDQAFKTMPGRLFASIWLLVSTLAVAKAFLYLAEMRIAMRHKDIAKLVRSRHMTAVEFLETDIDHKGFVTKSEFAVYKLKEMGKISEKDVMLICEQFEKLDNRKCGKITLSALIESHHLDTSRTFLSNDSSTRHLC